MKEHPEKGVYVKDLSAFVVKSVEEMDRLMEKGNGNRSVGSTNMNADSSRSHSIFTVTVEMSEPSPDGGDPMIRVGKLNLVREKYFPNYMLCPSSKLIALCRWI